MKNNITIFIAGVIIVLSSGYAYSQYIKSSSTSQVNSDNQNLISTEAKNPEVTQPSQQSTDESEMKTYTDKDFGISFKYPSEWTVGKRLGDGKEILTHISLEGSGHTITFLEKTQRDRGSLTGSDKYTYSYYTDYGSKVSVEESVYQESRIDNFVQIDSCGQKAIVTTKITTSITEARQQVKNIVKSVNCF